MPRLLGLWALLTRFPPMQRRPDYASPLHVACEQGILAVVKCLVAAGAQVNSVARVRRTTRGGVALRPLSPGLCCGCWLCGCAVAAVVNLQDDSTPLVVAKRRLREMSEGGEALGDGSFTPSRAAAEMAAVVAFLEEQGGEEEWRRDDPALRQAVQDAVKDSHTFGC